MSPKVNTWLITGNQRFNGYYLLIDDCQRSFRGGLVLKMSDLIPEDPDVVVPQIDSTQGELLVKV